MTSRRSLLVIASLLVAALGTSLVWLYAQGADQRATRAAQPVQVLHAASAVGVGTTVENLQVQTRTIPAAAAAGVLTSRAQVRGQALTVPVVAGQQLTTAMFAAAEVTGAAPGRAVAAVSVTGPRGVPALLRVGQEVAVYSLTRAAPPRLVVASTRVVSIGDATAGDAGPRATGRGSGREQIPGEVVSFDVSPAEAVDLLAIERDGQAALVVLGADTKAAPRGAAVASPGASARP